jgi:hypothetical protein
MAWVLFEVAEGTAKPKVAAAFLAGPVVWSAKQEPALRAARKAFGQGL